MIIDKDAVGAFISGLCLIHCLAGPVLLLLGITSIGHAHVDEGSLHLALLAPIMLLAAWSIPKGLKTHHQRLPAVLAVLGIGFLVAGLMVVSISLVATVIGSSMLVVAHIQNQQILKHQRFKQRDCQ